MSERYYLNKAETKWVERRNGVRYLFDRGDPLYEIPERITDDGVFDMYRETREYRIPVAKSRFVKKERSGIAGVFWSKEYDGKSVMELLVKYPKMTFAEIQEVIINEGGRIDEQGVVHAN